MRTLHCWHMLAAETKVVTASSASSLASEEICSWTEIIRPVEPFLEAVHARLARQVSEFEMEIGPYAEYALAGGGKHLRPALVALSANALGKTNEAHITAAVIIEMVHLATLVHDDVMDEGRIRRGKPTLAAQWGNEVAVLFGDCLFAQALKLAAGFPTPEICRAVAMSTKTVCSGEILQTQHRKDFQFSRDDYFRVLEMKTAELFALSSDLGAYLSGATPAQRNGARQFGLAFGTAYQVYDDCVDLFGSESAAGKSLGTDLAKGKLTLPVMLARERATAQDRARLERLVQNWDQGAFAELLSILTQYDALQGAVESVHENLEKARQILRALPETHGREHLLALTKYLARQVSGMIVCG